MRTTYNDGRMGFKGFVVFVLSFLAIFLLIPALLSKVLYGQETEPPQRTIHLSEKAGKDLKFLNWLSREKAEIATCVQGHFGINTDTVYVTEVRLATVRASGLLTIDVDYTSCADKRTVGLLHSHTVDSMCMISNPDVHFFHRSEQHRPYPLTFILCADGRLLSYDRHEANIVATESYIRETGMSPRSFTEVLNRITQRYKPHPAAYQAGHDTVRTRP